MWKGLCTGMSLPRTKTLEQRPIAQDTGRASRTYAFWLSRW